LREVKEFLSDAFNVTSIDEAKKLTDNFESLNIPVIKPGIFSPWLHYINPSIFPIVNGASKDLIQWLDLGDKYSKCIDSYQELMNLTEENNLGNLDYFAYCVKQYPKDASGFESNEDMALRLLRDKADKETIMSEFRKVYKEKKNIIDEDFIKSRVETYINLARRKLNLEQGILNESSPGYKSKAKYWLYAPGEDAKYWDLYSKEGSAGIGPNAIGNLMLFSSQEELGLKISEFRGEGRHSNDSLALWAFSRVMKPGDILIVKKGVSAYLGYGIVLTDYLYNSDRRDYHHFRKVKWRSIGFWEEESRSLPIKSLTDITGQTELVSKLKALMNIDDKLYPTDLDFDPIIQTTKNYWWLNANAKYWNIDDHHVGQIQSYTTHNESGNKRRIYEYFKKVKPGDLIIGYQSTPSLRTKALFEVTESAHINEEGDEEISFILKEFFPYQATWDELKNFPILKSCEVFINNQGSLFSLKKQEFETIFSLCKTGNTKSNKSYRLHDAMKDIFLQEENLKEILSLLEYKKNIILQGAPGTGKTYIAKRLAFLGLGEMDSTRIEMVQFHQSYTYEDFIQGYRPDEDGRFKLRNGIFYDFCLRAQRDPEHKYFFIIDEINRGNLSKIFGEIMMLVEHDKRGSKFGVTLTYSKDNMARFFIPENLYLVGTMNTADRSLAMVDYALRRRFAFITIAPAYKQEMFKSLLHENGVSDKLIIKIVTKMEDLNKKIADDDNLRKSFSIGHSYFCTKVESPNETWYKQVINNEIGPLLREYWFDDKQKAEENIKILLRD